ncbi:MAG: murein transglycosylase A [Legionellales bacterium]
MKLKLKVVLSILFLMTLATFLWLYLAPAKPTFRQVTFEQLPGWKTAAFKKSLLAFQVSCRTFIKQDPSRIVGTEQIELQAKDWQPACYAALKMNPVTEQTAKHFFEEWFVPVEFYDSKLIRGLFTGYYLPLLKGSYTQTDEFHVPIYELPKNLVTVDLGLFLPQLKNNKLVGRIEGNKLVPFYSREQINKGAIKDTAQVLLWVNSPIDRLFLEIQGSGIVVLEDGKRIYIGYDGQNGAPYTSIASVLIKKGIMTKENASMQGIKSYLETHPEQIDQVINQNKSFIFFRKLVLDAALGSQGVALTPGYSLAIDRQWIPMGAPLWLNTTRPDSKNPDMNKPMQRLMIAQDTGGAIRGKVRGDVFFGGGDKATLIAGHMKNEGHYWLLLPRHVLSRISK